MPKVTIVRNIFVTYDQKELQTMFPDIIISGYTDPTVGTQLIMTHKLPGTQVDESYVANILKQDAMKNINKFFFITDHDFKTKFQLDGALQNKEDGTVGDELVYLQFHGKILEYAER